MPLVSNYLILAEGSGGETAYILVGDTDPRDGAGLAAPEGTLLLVDGGIPSVGKLFVKYEFEDAAWERIMPGDKRIDTLVIGNAAQGDDPSECDYLYDDADPTTYSVLVDAIAALPVFGGVISIRNGPYWNLDNVTIGKSVVLRGTNMQSVSLGCDINVSAIGNGNFVSIEDLTLSKVDKTGTCLLNIKRCELGGAAAPDPAITISNGDSDCIVRIENCWFTDENIAISLSGTNLGNIHIRDNAFSTILSGATNKAIETDTATTYNLLEISGNYFLSEDVIEGYIVLNSNAGASSKTIIKGNDFDDDAIVIPHIVLQAPSPNIMSGIVISHNRAAIRDSFVLVDANADGIIVSENTITGLAAAAATVRLTKASGAIEHITISNNHATCTLFAAEADSTTVSDIIISGNSSEDSLSRCIYFDATTPTLEKITISNNTLTGSQLAAIYSAPNNDIVQVNIVGNMISDNNVGAGDNAEVELYGSCTRVMFSGNLIQTSASDINGISSPGTGIVKNCNFVNNNIVTGGYYAIYVITLTNSLITGNYLESTIGIAVIGFGAASSGVFIHGNTLYAADALSTFAVQVAAPGSSNVRMLQNNIQDGTASGLNVSDGGTSFYYTSNPPTSTFPGTNYAN